MKKRELEAKLKEYGWYLLRYGKKHDHWTNGDLIESVGRHNDIPEYTAKKIIKNARNNPGKK